jgi:hypothetical protein
MYFLFRSSNSSLSMYCRCFENACFVIVSRAFGSSLKKLSSSMERDFPVSIRKNSVISSKFIFCFDVRENAVFFVRNLFWYSRFFKLHNTFVTLCSTLLIIFSCLFIWFYFVLMNFLKL